MTASFHTLEGEPLGSETLPFARGRERSAWETSAGRFTVEQEFGHTRTDGWTRIQGPAELHAPVAWRFNGYGRYLRRGVELRLDGQAGVLVRPTYGMRSSRRQLLIRFSDDRTWRVRARSTQLELRRDEILVCTHSGVSQLSASAGPQDAAISILLTANGLWYGAAFWSRIAGGLLDGI